MAPDEPKKDLTPPVPIDSATESEGDNSASPGKKSPVAGPSHPSLPVGKSEKLRTNRDSPRRVSPLPSASKAQISGSDSDSSPVRPKKKLKKPIKSSSDDEDSEQERKRRVAQLVNGGEATGGKRGTRQPIKRGGKRF